MSDRIAQLSDEERFLADFAEPAPGTTPPVHRAGLIAASWINRGDVVRLSIPTDDGGVHRFAITYSTALHLVARLTEMGLEQHEREKRPERYQRGLQIAQSAISAGSRSLDGSPVVEGQSQ